MRPIACWVSLSIATVPYDVRRIRRRYGTIDNLFRREPLPIKPHKGVGPVDLERHAEGILARCERLGVQVVPFDDERYPEPLRSIARPPPVLYAVGDLQHLLGPGVAIVGSRKCTAYGKWVARKLARGLSRSGVRVISGMAFGIDAAAHTGALDVGCGTIAVLAGGPEKASPASLEALYQRIAGQHLVISEFPPGTSPRAEFFPRRNRIVAGLSRGVIVVEAGTFSGALITAKIGLEEGREVFAVPGQLDSVASTGPNQLLRSGANPVTGWEDVLADLSLEPASQLAADGSDGDETVRLLGYLRRAPLTVDVLEDRSGIPSERLRSLLLRARLLGMVGSLPGERYYSKE